MLPELLITLLGSKAETWAIFHSFGLFLVGKQLHKHEPPRSQTDVSCVESAKNKRVLPV